MAQFLLYGLHGYYMEINHKLELCAFALKGEHNAYSLVPNIPVCIYIDQKWIYIHSRNFFVNVFFKMAAGSHFGCPKITYYHFRSIPQFKFL